MGWGGNNENDGNNGTPSKMNGRYTQPPNERMESHEKPSQEGGDDDRSGVGWGGNNGNNENNGKPSKNNGNTLSVHFAWFSVVFVVSVVLAALENS